VTAVQLEITDTFRANSVEKVRDRYQGIMQTVWSPAESLLEQYYSEDPELNSKGQVGSLKAIINHYSYSE
jgi:hypothetical protein